MRGTLLVLCLVAIFASGCAVYPTSRTYFEPNPSDGIPAPSMSCGYHAAKNDSLAREIGGVKIKVTPYYKEGKELQIIVLLQGQEDRIKIDPKKILLEALSIEEPVSPTAIKQTIQEPRNNWPYYMKWNYLTYPLLSESLDTVSVVFQAGSVKLDNEPLKLKNFRFKKTTKSDIYYGSINC